MTREDEIRARLKGERAFTTMLLFDDIDYLLKRLEATEDQMGEWICSYNLVGLENQRFRQALEEIVENSGQNGVVAIARQALEGDIE